MGTLPKPAGCEVLGGDSAVRWASATVFNITSAFQVCSWNPSTPQGQWALGVSLHLRRHKRRLHEQPQLGSGESHKTGHW